VAGKLPSHQIIKKLFFSKIESIFSKNIIYPKIEIVFQK